MLGADVRVDRLGTTILDGMSVSGEHGLCIESAAGLRIVCRGSIAESTLVTIAPVESFPLRIRTLASQNSIVRAQREGFSSLLVASLIALTLLGGVAGLTLWLAARRRREEIALTGRLADTEKLAALE